MEIPSSNKGFYEIGELSRGNSAISVRAEALAPGSTTGLHGLLGFGSDLARHHFPLAALIVGYWFLARLVLPGESIGVGWISLVAATVLVGYYAIAITLIYACRVAFSSSRGARILTAGETWRRYFSQVWTPRRISGGLSVFLLTPILMGAFSTWKAAIPLLNPFSWDRTFAEFDRFLHFGTDPWRLAHGLPGSDVAIWAVDTLYSTGWVVATLITYTFLAWGTWNTLRLQYLLTFALSWIVLGSGIATWLSAAGPCFFQGVTGNDYFAPLMARLAVADQTAPLRSVEVQRMLWSAYEQRTNGLLSGISAMPSMHVAMATLVAVVGWKVHRWLGVLTTIFAAAIFVGSVYLGFHYAVDGYVSVVGVFILWISTGAFSRWWFGAVRST